MDSTEYIKKLAEDASNAVRKYSWGDVAYSYLSALTPLSDKLDATDKIVIKNFLSESSEVKIWTLIKKCIVYINTDVVARICYSSSILIIAILVVGLLKANICRIIMELLTVASTIILCLKIAINYNMAIRLCKDYEMLTTSNFSGNFSRIGNYYSLLIFGIELFVLFFSVIVLMAWHLNVLHKIIQKIVIIFVRISLFLYILAFLFQLQIIARLGVVDGKEIVNVYNVRKILIFIPIINFIIYFTLLIMKIFVKLMAGIQNSFERRRI